MPFYTIIQNICQQHGTTPTALCKALGLSTSMVTNWKNGRIPNGATLQKIADYFSVSVDELLGNEKKEQATILTPNTAIGTLSQREINLILRYRQMTDMQSAVDKLLGLPDGDEPLIPVYVAAHSENNAPDRIEYLTREEAERLKNAPPADFDF